MSRTEGRSRSPAPQFPASLAGFKLGWTEAGQLRQVREDGEVGEEAFQFNVSDKHQYNQVYIYFSKETQERLNSAFLNPKIHATYLPRRGTKRWASW